MSVTVELVVDVDAPSVVRVHVQRPDGSCGAMDESTIGGGGTTSGGTTGSTTGSTTSSTNDTGSNAPAYDWVSLRNAFVADPSDGALTLDLWDGSNWGPESDCVCAVVMAANGVDGVVSPVVCAP
ncbi:MAG: hypothetical protein ABMB14_23640 [Myxococcota bacterium]